MFSVDSRTLEFKENTEDLGKATKKGKKGAVPSLRLDSAPLMVRVREKTSYGPAKSRISTSLNINIPTLIFFILNYPHVIY